MQDSVRFTDGVPVSCSLEWKANVGSHPMEERTRPPCQESLLCVFSSIVERYIDIVEVAEAVSARRTSYPSVAQWQCKRLIIVRPWIVTKQKDHFLAYVIESTIGKHMRSLSATQIKRNIKGKKTNSLRREPAEGTVTRELFDKLTASIGKPINILENTMTERERHSICSALARLRLFYGLDIRLIRISSSKGSGLHCLVGEWFGKIYVDYTADTDEHMTELAEVRYALQHIEHPENILPPGVHYLSKKSADILAQVAAKGRELAEKHQKKE